MSNIMNTVRTIIGSDMQTTTHLGLPHLIREFTSMDEAILDPQIVPKLPSVRPLGMEYPQGYDHNTDSINIKAQYFCIGIAGHRAIDDATVGATKVVPVPHKATDSGLYRMTPFVVRPIANDLTAEQRKKYRLRRTLQIGTDLYVAYYARKFDLSDTAPELKLTSISAGVKTTTIFRHTAANLKPTPPPVGVTDDGSFVHVSSVVTVNFTQEELTWLREASELLYGSPDFAMISEIAVCSGVDKPITQRYPNTGSQTATNVTGDQLKEAVGVQALAFISTFHAVTSNTMSLDIVFDLGATEPLYGKDT